MILNLLFWFIFKVIKFLINTLCIIFLRYSSILMIIITLLYELTNFIFLWFLMIVNFAIHYFKILINHNPHLTLNFLPIIYQILTLNSCLCRHQVTQFRNFPSNFRKILIFKILLKINNKLIIRTFYFLYSYYFVFITSNFH